jgi:predicted Zn-dependent protease
MNKERLTQLSETLMEIPSRITELQGRILDYNEEAQKLSGEIALKEAAIKTEINSQTDENGKKLYTNAESREAAFMEVAKENSELKEMKEKLSSLQGFLSIEKIKLEEQNNTQRNIRSILYFFAGTENDMLLS